MAIPDGKPATDFSAMNREWVRAVAAEAAESGGSGIPAPENPSDGDVLTYDSTSTSWVAAAPGGGGVVCIPLTIDELNSVMVLGATYAEIEALMTAGTFLFFKQVSEGEIGYRRVSYIWEGSDPHDTPYNVVIDGNLEFYCLLKSEYPSKSMT